MPHYQELTPRGESRSNSVKTILVVEDDADIGSFLIQAILQETTHQAMLVTDGFQALKVIANIQPSLLILDYQLPSMNGIELYDRIQETHVYVNLPTILISARLPKQEIAKRKIIGMAKPLELDEFLQTIEKLLV
jgi:DNA-binding response OmpR family regulator